MSLSLRAMRYVQTAMQMGSISAAAQAMHVAPSAIAAALDQAENQFGVALVTRARAKGVFPTLAGRDVLRRIEDMLERYDAMFADVSDLQTGLSGTLAIGYNAPIAPAFLSKIAATLRASHPEVSLQFFDGDNRSVQNGFLSGKFDVILFVEELPNVQIEAAQLLFAPTYCLCAAGHHFAGLDRVAVSQISQEPLVLLDRPAARTYYLDLLEKSGKEFDIVATANSTEMVRSLVAMGMGISLLNMRPGDIPAYAGPYVRCVPVADSSHGVTLSLGFAPGPRRRLVELFLNSCRAFFDGPEGSGFTVS